MIPLPTSKVFRSRGGALRWAFWVIVAAVATVGFMPDKHAADSTGQADIEALASLLNAQ